MKKKQFIFLCILFCFCLFFFPSSSVSVYAENVDYQEKLGESVIGQLNELDLKALEDYVRELEGNESLNLKERLLEYVKGGGFGLENFFQELLELLFSSVKQMIPSFACIAAIGLLCGILNSLQSQHLKQSTSKLVFFSAYLGALIPIFGILSEGIFCAQEAVSSMQKQMQIVFPLMLTLIAASGGSVSVAIYQPSVAFLCNTLVSMIEKIVFPITIAIIVFSMSGKMFGELKTEKFATFFKSVNKWIMGIGFSVFGLFFTVQGLTAASYDGIVRRAAKYALGTGVPIVGGFLSSGFDLAVAGSMLIKNSLGNFSLFLLITVLFEPLTLLIAINLLLRLTAAITQPFGDSKIASFLEETAGNLNYLVAGLLFTAFLYFIVVLLLVCSTEMFL